jgi:putative redox protein
MESGREIIVRLTGKRRVEAQLGGHRVLTDQPRSNGGEDAAPSPFQLFLASLGTCAGIFVQGFCAKRGIPYHDIRLVERPTYGSNGALESVEFELQVPPDFPPDYHAALLRVIDQCSVKRVLQSPPTFQSRVSQGSSPGRPRATVDVEGRSRHADVTMTMGQHGHFAPDHEARQLAELQLGIPAPEPVSGESLLHPPTPDTRRPRPPLPKS